MTSFNEMHATITQRTLVGHTRCFLPPIADVADRDERTSRKRKRSCTEPAPQFEQVHIHGKLSTAIGSFIYALGKISEHQGILPELSRCLDGHLQTPPTDKFGTLPNTNSLPNSADTLKMRSPDWRILLR